MGQMQGIQGDHTIQTLNNDIYDSTGGNKSSSYISLSGIKSVLLNAWNAVKAAVSGMLSSFGLHLSGQQGSDKPGRDITMDMSSRSAMPLLGIDEQFDNMLDGSNNDETGTTEADDPANHIYEDLDDYRRAGNVIGSEDRVLVCDDTYAKPYDSLKADGRAEQEGMDPEYASLHENIYSEPYKPGDTISTPENDPRGDSDYDTPWKSQPDQQLQQRRIRERLNTL
ncbi:TPA: hypothetical protein SLN72_002517 [Morganella morganii]|nr:hypothetical protein [Morganella morganii]